MNKLHNSFNHNEYAYLATKSIPFRYTNLLIIIILMVDSGFLMDGSGVNLE